MSGYIEDIETDSTVHEGTEKMGRVGKTQVQTQWYRGS